MHVLTAEDKAFWDENGYVIIHNAVPQENLDAVIEVMWDFLQIDRHNPDDWYREPVRRGGMVELYQHQALWNNRQHPRVYGAFADIWGTEQLWVSLDRVNFNPPDRPDWDYPGFIHWDIDTAVQPVPFWVQGVLYLADTSEEQGGFQCVPGFHRLFPEWVKTQPADRHPRRPDLTGFEVQAIPGKAGDLLIWHSLLPHGNGRNRTNQPRLAQYITMYPPRDNAEERAFRIQAWQERLPPRGGAFPGDPRGLEQKEGQTAELTPLGKRLLGLEAWES
jgi:hypothetical protein